MSTARGRVSVIGRRDPPSSRAATTACPKEMPPSFAGRRSGTRTRRPPSSRSAAVCSSSVRFWKTPPDSTTRSSPLARAIWSQALGSRQGQSTVKASRHERRFCAFDDIREHGEDRLPGVEQQRTWKPRVLPNRERIRVLEPRRGSIGLELDRGLALVAASVRRPQSAATASNRRPALVVAGDAIPRRARLATAAQREASMRPSSVGGKGGSAPSTSTSQAHAIRHGSRIARSPPGSETGQR